MTVACWVLQREVGLTGHSIILYMSSGARALLIAMCLRVHTKGGKLRYEYSSGRPHGQVLCKRAEGKDLCYYMFIIVHI